MKVMLVSRYAATFAGTPQSVTCARKKVWDYLADCPLADDACLIVSEFASNAVLHSLSRVGTFTVRCDVFSTYVYVECEDDGGVWCKPEPDGRPHGLDIVTLLVGDGNWGIEPTSEGQRVVWARLELSLTASSLRLPWAIVRPRETAPVHTHQPGLSLSLGAPAGIGERDSDDGQQDQADNDKSYSPQDGVFEGEAGTGELLSR
jgi:hypothetical protein